MIPSLGRRKPVDMSAFRNAVWILAPKHATWSEAQQCQSPRKRTLVQNPTGHPTERSELFFYTKLKYYFPTNGYPSKSFRLIIGDELGQF